LNTEFDRILPEHIVFYVTHVKTVQHLINLIEWKRKKLRTGWKLTSQETEDWELIREVLYRSSVIVVNDGTGKEFDKVC